MVVNKVVALSQLQNIWKRFLEEEGVWGGFSFWIFQYTKKSIRVRQLNWLIGARPKTPLRACLYRICCYHNMIYWVINWVIYWVMYWVIQSNILSNILSTILSNILSDVLSNILNNVLSNILSNVLTNILSNILSDILSGRLSNTQTYRNGILTSFGLMHLT